MNRNVGLAIAAIAATGTATVISCTFPDIGFRGAGGGGAATQTSSSAGTGGKATTSTAGSGGLTTSSTGPSSTGSASSSSGVPECDSGKPCDCDDDHDNADSDECAHDGGDCNDHDPLVSSKQTAYFMEAGTHGWDYNCDGKDELANETLILCPSGLAGTTCDKSTQGWEGTQIPPCGGPGTLGTCQGGGLGPPCSYNVSSTFQGCH